MRHVVFDGSPESADYQQPARLLEADMLEQMGYQAENATWRNFFLAGAQELRNGILQIKAKPQSPTMVAAMTTSMIFDALAAKLIGPWVGTREIVMNWIFVDPVDPFIVRVQNGAMTYVQGKLAQSANVTLMLSRDTLNKLMVKQLSLRQALEEKRIDVSGERAALLRFFCLLDDDDPSFPIVTPRSDAKDAWLATAHRQQLLNLLEGKAKEADLLDHPAVSQAREFLGELPRGC